MRKIKILSLVLSLAALAALDAFAGQRPAVPTSEPTRNTYGERAPASPGDHDNYEMTRSITGKIAEIKPDEWLIVVRDNKGKSFQFILDKKTRLKADKKTELEGKKELTFEDFHPGHSVKVTFWPSNSKVTEIRMRQADKES